MIASTVDAESMDREKKRFSREEFVFLVKSARRVERWRKQEGLENELAKTLETLLLRASFRISTVGNRGGGL